MGAEQSQERNSGDAAAELDPEDEAEVELNSKVQAEVSGLRAYARSVDEEEAELFQTNGHVFDFTKAETDSESQLQGNHKGKDVEKYMIVRKKTLARYNELLDLDDEVKGGAESANSKYMVNPKSNSIFLRAVDTGMKSRSQNSSTKRKKNIKRAMTLKKAFFEKVDAAVVGETIETAEEDTAYMEPESQRWIDCVDHNEEEIEVDEKDYFYADMENAIQERISKIQSENKNLTADEEELLQNKIAEIKQLRKKLQSTQKYLIERARKDAQIVVKKIKKELKSLKNEIKAKHKEDYENELSDVVENSNKQKINLKMNGNKRNPGNIKKKIKPRNAEKQEKKYIKEINYLKSERAALQKALKQLMLERQFPRCMKWKMRVDGGDGLYVGIRDMEIEKLNCFFEIATGIEPGMILLKVSNLDAIIGVLEFIITGKSALAKILGGVLTPTVNRLDFIVSGEWQLCLRYNELKAKWMEDRKKSFFRLDIKKEVSGITTIRLPASFVNLLSNIIFPRLISAAIREALPTELNTFGYSEFRKSTCPFFAQGSNKINLTGSFSVQGEMSPDVWRAPLYSPTRSSLAARKALKMNIDEAFALDYILRSSRATSAGFFKRSITLERLYKWRLKYAVYDIEQLEPLLDLIQQQVSHPAGRASSFPTGWLAQIYHRVEELSRKPVRFNVQVFTCTTDLDLLEVARNGMQIYLANLIDQKLDKSQSDKARIALEKEIETTKLKSIQTLKYLHELAHYLSDRLNLRCNTLMDGRAGLLLGSLDNLCATVVLGNINPMKIIIPSQKEDIPIWISGENDPNEGEYTVTISGTEPSQNLQDSTNHSGAKANLTLRNANLSLFPNNSPQGTVRITADRLRGVAGFGILDDVITSSFAGSNTINGQDDMEREKRLIGENLRDDNIQILLDESAAIIARLWRDYDRGKVSNLEYKNNTFRHLNGTKDAVFESQYSSLPNIICDEQNNFFVECRGLSLTLLRVINAEKEGDATVRLISSLNPDSSSHKNNDHAINFTIRQDIGKVFDNL